MRIDSFPKDDGFYMPAEFEPHDATIMIFPERPGSWPYKAVKAQKVFSDIIRKIGECEKVYVVVSDNTEMTAREMLSDVPSVTFLKIPTDDAWARDTAPTFVRNSAGEVRGISWRFNAWGGEVDGLYRHYDKDDALASAFCDAAGYDHYDALDFVIEGGAVHSNGAGTLMVTESCLLSAGRNPLLSKGEIEDRLKNFLGAQRVIWLPRGIYNDETNEHVDNVCAFIDEDSVVLAWTSDKEDPQYELSLSCLKVLEEAGLFVHKLPIPDVPVTVSAEDLNGYEFEEGEDKREVGERLAASYVNFYFCNDYVLLPQFGGVNEKSDRRAVEIMTKICKQRKIIPVPAEDIIKGGGNIHCITQQIPRGAGK